MNAFQERCWSRCEGLLREAQVDFSGPTQVEGKRESYFIARFSRDGDEIELFIYNNEAGVMVNARDWRIFETPDFDSEELLIQAYTKHLSRLLEHK